MAQAHIFLSRATLEPFREQLCIVASRGGHFKTESELKTNPNIRVRFLYVLYFGVWIRVRLLTFKTRIDLITRNIKKLLICDIIII
jgi:hypothetical protein